MAGPPDVKSIFLAAADMPPSERAAFLDEACGGDAELRQRIEALLKAHDDTGGWLGEPATPTSDYPGFTAPSIAELAPLFPQLDILELLGRGGMGAVYKARQRNLDRFVALKILPHDSGDAAFAERFTREARTLAKLNHPGIVAVHDFGTANGLFWFVMEFVDGVNLRQAKKAGTLTPAAALAIVPKICEALQFAHDAGVVHRDIKPENVLLDAKGRVKIADFGLAKLLDRGPERSHLTGTHQAMGTPHYMAPEQWERPLEVDHRADIYSLGVVIYELLTGELPLGRFAPPSQKVQIDVRLDEVVLRTLEKEPDRRYQHASEVKTDVERIALTGKTPTPHGEPDRLPPARPISLFWTVILPTLLLTTIAAVAAMYFLAGIEGPAAAHEMQGKTAILGANVALVVFVTLLLAWFHRRQPGSVTRSVVSMWRFCRFDSPTTWAILVCVLGLANSFVPWLQLTAWVNNSPLSHSWQVGWQSGFNRLFEHCGPCANATFPALALALMATGVLKSMRAWRALTALVTGLTTLAFSILYIKGADGNPNDVPLNPQFWFSVSVFLGPYVAIALAAALLLFGAIELRGWLATRDSVTT